jgi:hypothetical protein
MPGKMKLSTAELMLARRGVQLFRAAQSVGRATHRFRRGSQRGFVDFSGTWMLDKVRSDSPDATLRALGVGWMKRKLAAKIVPLWTVHHEMTPAGPTWHEEIVAAGVFSTKETVPLDGSRVRKSQQGYDVTQRCWVEEGGECVTIHVLYDDLPGYESISRQRIIEGGATICVRSMLTTAKGEKIVRTSYWVRRV